MRDGIDYVKIVQTATVMALQELTDDEAVAFNLCLILDNDPEINMAWPKVEPLYTQADGKAMHPDVKEVALGYLAQRVDAIWEARRPNE